MPESSQAGNKIWRIVPSEIDSRLLTALGSMLRKGNLVIYPTETYYALGGVPSREVCGEIFEIKGRDFGKPLPLIAAGKEAVLSAATAWPATADRLANTFWPGPLTLILPAAASLPPILHAGTGKIAIRVSSHSLASSLAQAAGGLLISTSANPAGEPPPHTPGMISEDLLQRVEAFLDAGDLSGGFPSTIVDVTVQPPFLVRAGKIGWKEILASL